MKRKGVSTQLLERVCRDAARDGFDVIEAYPNKAFINDAEDFMGPVALYKKAGFTVHGETGQKYIMRKPL